MEVELPVIDETSCNDDELEAGVTPKLAKALERKLGKARSSSMISSVSSGDSFEDPGTKEMGGKSSSVEAEDVEEMSFFSSSLGTSGVSSAAAGVALTTFTGSGMSKTGSLGGARGTLAKAALDLFFPCFL